ncbi:TonB-dependent receptor [Edaphobacter modestus]|uniref:Carboxypeptidase family protein n=1 Tax=Edaphobacter modestus TaxID=388466 RepID=A0A4Q7YX35_9BACT|nr:TonB-dependent receptor [Edaphobacter modestus]RZU42397.1 carboxypeptidase family protein [Edaphobacter modestus]
MKFNRQNLLAILLLLLASSVPLLRAQVRSATITGTVTDSTGAVVVDADVVARDESTNVQSNSKTTQTGQFTIPYLAAGTYTVTIVKDGFQKYSASSVRVNASEIAKVDSILSVGTATQQVDVQSSAQQLQTESSTITAAVSAQVIDAIPNITQNPLYYTTLQNGVQPRNQTSSSQSLNSFGIGVAGRAQYSSIGVNGGRAFENDIQLDGLPITGNGFNEAAIIPNQEGIQEVRVISNNFTADYGRGMSVMAINTKSGGNQFHGQASYMIRNEAFNANSPGNKAQGIRRPAFKVNDYGGALSGPIVRDKLFFSTSYHYLSFNQGQTYLQTVPTALERVGNFSQTYIQGANGQPVAAQIFDPYNVTQVGPNLYQRALIPNAIIPNPNPAALLMYSFYPLPNRTPDDVYNTNNYTSNVSNTVRRQTLSSRIDYKLGSHSFYSSGGYDFGKITQPRPFGTAPFNNAATATQDNNYYAQIGDTITVRPTLFVDVRYGVTRISTYNLAGNQSGFTQYNEFGIAPATQALFAVPGSAPVVNPNGFSGGTGGGSNWSALSSGQFANKRESQIAHAINGSITKVSGNWTYKAGSEYRVMLANYTDFEEGSANIGGCCAADPGGNYSFQFVTASGGSAPNNTSPTQSGVNAATLLLGQGVWFVRPGANLKPAYAAKYFAVYTQNDWKARQNLTINLGLRWDVQPGLTERYNRMTAIDLTKNNPFGSKGVFAFPGVNGYSRGLWDTEWHDFQPRVGFAFQPYQGTVVRGGFGITYLPSNSGYFSSSNDYGGAPFAAGNQALPYGSNPSGVPVTRFTDPAPLVAAVGANQAAPQIYGTATTYFDRNLKNQVAKQANLFVEQSFGKNSQWIMSIGWSASFSNNLTTRSQPFQNLQTIDQGLLANWHAQYVASNGKNDPSTLQVPNPYQTGAQLVPFQGALSARTIQQQIPKMPYPLLWGASIDGSKGYADYHSLQARLSHAFASGFNIQANYTWSKELDYVTTPIEDGQGVNSGGTVGTPDLIHNGLNRNYGLADTPNRFVATIVYNSQFGKNGKYALNNLVARVLLGGWSVGSVISLQSGMPIVVLLNNNGGALTSRLDRVPDQNIQVPSALQKRYDGKTTVTLPCGKTVTPGKYQLLKYNACAFAGRTITNPDGSFAPDIYWIGNHAQTSGDLRGPGRANMDLSLRRAFPVRERYRIEISGEATNLLNNAQFNGAYVGNLGSTNLTNNPSGGLIPGLGTSSTFGTLNLNSFDPRQIQLHGRFIF